MHTLHRDDLLLQASIAECPKISAAWLGGKTLTPKTDARLGREGGREPGGHPPTGCPHGSQPGWDGNGETGLWVGALLHSKAKWLWEAEGVSRPVTMKQTDCQLRTGLHDLLSQDAPPDASPGRNSPEITVPAVTEPKPAH